MAKNKAELQADCESYRNIASKVRSALEQRQFSEAVDLAVSAFEFIDGMMQFERRFENRTDRKSVQAIDCVLQFAPLLLDSVSLQKVSDILKSQKRIEKNTTADLTTNLSKAFALLWQAHRLWHQLEQQPETIQDSLRRDLGGDQDLWRWIVEKWDEMGLVRRTPERNTYRLSLATRLEEQVRGKCPACGVTGKATKERLLDPINCPKCKANVYFVFLSG